MSNTQLGETRSQASPQGRRSAFASDDQYSPQENIVFDPDAWLYRERTVALLRRYLRISIEVGRLPSLLGRELFRSKVTSYRMSSFEDGVIFVHDVEQALDQLNEFPRQLIATIVFQEYTQEEAAEVLRCGRRTVCREFPAALDRMTEIFLEGGLLNYLPLPPVEKTCQEANEGDF
jgi:DNA-directed RNA polymerase specialized sigma24 family protein